MKIRRATPEDALAIAHVHVRSWQAAYRGLIDDEFLDALRPEHRVPIYEFGAAAAGETETIVAEAAGEIIGSTGRWSKFAVPPSARRLTQSPVKLFPPLKVSA